MSEVSETPVVVKELSDALRAHIGLAAGEGLRLLVAGPRTIILERFSDPQNGGFFATVPDATAAVIAPRKPLEATAAEKRLNPRSRSAKLRAAVRK